MRSPILRIIIIILLIFTIIDLYFQWSIYRVLKGSCPEKVILIYLTVSSLIWLFILTGTGRFFLSFKKNAGPALFNNMNTYTGIILFIYFPKILFIPFSLLADLLLVINGILGNDSALLINIASIITHTGLVLILISSILILYGIIYGRFNFTFRKYNHTVPDLPDQFDGMRIIHLSDLHTGSLRGHQGRYARVVNLVNDLHPDLILFTGDLVNNFAEELEGWSEILGGLKARWGIYAVLGNHDYGEYFKWRDKQQWQSNINRLMEYEESMGFKLLMNESLRISINGQHITIIGVENWGLPPFKQYGDLQKAMEMADSNDFKILLSHDPSHWEAQVLNKTDINLTLSGHTHGMQFGIRIGKVRWSPIRLMYPRWAGWYQEGGQYLHVSTGLGYIGFPVRIGMPPEVAIIQLNRISHPKL